MEHADVLKGDHGLGSDVGVGEGKVSKRGIQEASIREHDAHESKVPGLQADGVDAGQIPPKVMHAVVVDHLPTGAESTPLYIIDIQCTMTT
jgi:hypothetical protein